MLAGIAFVRAVGCPHPEKAVVAMVGDCTVLWRSTVVVATQCRGSSAVVLLWCSVLAVALT